MSDTLYKINRYWGDDLEKLQENSSRKDLNLCALLQKVEERRKRRSVKLIEDEVGNQPVPECLEPKVKRSRKSNSVEEKQIKKDCDNLEESEQKENLSESLLTEQDDSFQCENVKRKKKKRKHETAGYEELQTDIKQSVEKKDDDDISPTTQEETVKPRKKTKEQLVVKQAADDILEPEIQQKDEGTEHEKDELNFTVLGEQDFSKKLKVKRVLPSWLSHPSVVPVDLKNLTVTLDSFAGLDKRLVRKLKKNKITHFFPVQVQLIPWLLKCHKQSSRFWPQDVCVSAPTGSGKTLAFVLPIVQILSQYFVKHVRALIVLPTKDLAMQVFNVFRQYAAGSKLKVMRLISGVSSFEKEKEKLVSKDEYGEFQSLVDIIVATPGRLVEHLRYTPGFSLAHLKFLVIDEADHVMESTQNDWLYHLRKHLISVGVNYSVPYLTVASAMSKPFRPQRLLFSATLSQDPEKLQTLELFQPKLFTSVVETNTDKSDNNDVEEKCVRFVGKYTTPKELSEFYTVCQLSVKPLVLYHLLRSKQWNHVMCFVNSVSNVHRLATLLHELSVADEKPLVVKRISSKVNSREHAKIITGFKKGGINVLVTTDSLARGIDILAVKCVVLYDLPSHAKTYIHRVGRTGRAGQEGVALTIVTPDQEQSFSEILESTGKNDVKKIGVDLLELKTLESSYKKALDKLREQVEKEDSKSFKKKGKWKKKNNVTSRRIIQR